MQASILDHDLNTDCTEPILRRANEDRITSSALKYMYN